MHFKSFVKHYPLTKRLFKDFFMGGGKSLNRKEMESERTNTDHLIMQMNIKAKSKGEFPLIILSGMNFSDNINKGMTLGANQFLTKPVVMERLYTAVTEELINKIQTVG